MTKQIPYHQAQYSQHVQRGTASEPHMQAMTPLDDCHRKCRIKRGSRLLSLARLAACSTSKNQREKQEAHEKCFCVSRPLDLLGGHRESYGISVAPSRPLKGSGKDKNEERRLSI